MWYLILLLLSSLVGCANRYSEECFLWGKAGGTGDDYGTKGAVAPKSLGTTDLNQFGAC
jgi:hypothetical protein